MLTYKCFRRHTCLYISDQIFNAGGWTGQPEVVQEILADLRIHNLQLDSQNFTSHTLCKIAHQFEISAPPSMVAVVTKYEISCQHMTSSTSSFYPTRSLQAHHQLFYGICPEGAFQILFLMFCPPQGYPPPLQT